MSRTTSTAPKVAEIPKQWPKSVIDLYEPVGKLGKGGFGSVVLARRKGSTKVDANHLVAIKVVGSEKVSSAEVGYAHREIDILKHLHHPNIVKYVNSWELPAEQHSCAAIIALEYVKGPTLESLLREGGALSLQFSRTVVAQLCDAVAYLHSHAVIHRDLKPDNIIIKGASFSQDDIWDNPATAVNMEAVPWAVLRAKWHVTLIDFGFARAFAPEDLQAVTTVSALSLGSSQGFGVHRNSISDSSSGKKPISDHTISKALRRRMSALGNKHYAAPEIVGAVRERNVDTSDASVTISHYVSDYAMVADAYSLGSVIRYMVTGVSPDQNFDQVAAMDKHPATRVVRWMTKRLSGKGKNNTKKMKTTKRKRKLRFYEDLPTEVVRLIIGMTHADPKRRTTVRAARRFPWIADILDDWDDSQKIQCLEFTRHQKKPIQVFE